MALLLGSVPPTSPIGLPSLSGLQDTLEQLAPYAAELDRSPRFPRESFAVLSAAGIPQLAAEHAHGGLSLHGGLSREIALVRALASVDGSSARILDGHFNGVERLALCAPAELRDAELELVRRGRLLLGVWGADPVPGEGSAARIERDADGAPVLRGVKTFCSGAGGVQRALVVARDEWGARRLAYADVTRSVEIDRNWYRASGLRSSESHRVVFADTPVLAILGGEDELLREPWFSRDAVRTAATWAGLADCIVVASVSALGGKDDDELRMHALGRMRVAQGTIDRWLDHAMSGLDREPLEGEHDDARTDKREIAPMLAGECRVALAEAARLIAAEAIRACGSRPLLDGGALDRARRDLDLFLLQHRLDPKLVGIGVRTLQGGML